LDVRLTTRSGKNIVIKEAMAGLSEGQLAGDSEEGLGSKGAVVPMMVKMNIRLSDTRDCTVYINVPSYLLTYLLHGAESFLRS